MRDPRTQEGIVTTEMPTDRIKLLELAYDGARSSRTLGTLGRYLVRSVLGSERSPISRRSNGISPSRVMP